MKAEYHKELDVNKNYSSVFFCKIIKTKNLVSKT